MKKEQTQCANDADARTLWQQMGLLKEGYKGKTFTFWRVMYCINWSKTGVWQTLDNKGDLRTHFLNVSRTRRLNASKDAYLTAFTFFIGPLSLICAPLRRTPCN